MSKTISRELRKGIEMARLIATVIQWALFLGVSGGLVDATIAMRKEAAKVHQIGMISLGHLNRSLLGQSHNSR
ncbi:MAG TPA: hypothetical protein DIS93_08620 [Bdellovibrionales bacterium]|nr:hypothetical protein [Bdellovibrionales bacterium]